MCSIDQMTRLDHLRALLACTGRSSSHHWLEEMCAARPDAVCERALSGVVCKGVGWAFKPHNGTGTLPGIGEGNASAWFGTLSTEDGGHGSRGCDCTMASRRAVA